MRLHYFYSLHYLALFYMSYQIRMHSLPKIPILSLADQVCCLVVLHLEEKKTLFHCRRKFCQSLGLLDDVLFELKALYSVPSTSWHIENKELINKIGVLIAIGEINLTFAITHMANNWKRIWADGHSRCKRRIDHLVGCDESAIT
jgi:hypothetical protein